MAILKSTLSTIVIGLGFAVVFYWLAILFGRFNGTPESFKWWLKIITIQGVVLAIAAKMIGIL